MHSRRTALLATLVVTMAACNAATPGATQAPTSPPPTPAATASAALTPDDTPDWRATSTPLPSAASTLAWWAEPGVTTCGLPARYRIDNGQIQGAGNCAAMLLKPASSAEMREGQSLDMHMLGDSAAPIYPLPQSPDDHVLRLVSQSDNGGTGTYEAIGAGTVVLMSNGPCLDVNTESETNGPCPVLTVTVTP